MIRKWVGLLTGLFLTSQVYATHLVEVVLVRTADTNGNNPSTETLENFKTEIEHANAIWAGTGVQFKFDPTTGFPPIVKDTLLHHDFMLAAGETLNQPKTQEPKINGTIHSQAKNNFVRKNYWGKLVVFSGIGDMLKFNDGLGKWQIIPRDYAYSNILDLYVQWFNGDASPNVLAHELGHHLHLGHTHGWLPKDKTEFVDLVTKGITQWGYNKNNVANMFDGDAGTVLDTPADPGPDLWKQITGDPCGPVNQISIPVTVNNQSFNVNFATDRRNVMSYFKDCNFPEGLHLSTQQGKRAVRALEFGNRLHLINKNPGPLIPQWSPDVEAVSWGPQRLDLFVTGADQKTQHKAYSPSTGWVPAMQYGAEFWNNLGGLIIGKPTAVAWGTNRLDVFVRGLDNKVYHKAWDGQSWKPGSGVADWENLGGVLAGSPVAVSWAKERLDIFGRGFNGHLYHKWWSPQTGWGPTGEQWEDLGGKLSTDPVAISWGPNRLDIIARGYDGSVQHKAWGGNAWYPSIDEWNSLGGNIVGQPSIASWSAGRLDIVARGADNQVYHKAWAGNGWYPSASGWSSLGGSVTSKPSIVSWGPGRLDIVVTGADTQLYHKAYQEGGGWYPNQAGWSNIGGWALDSSSPEIVSWSANRLDIFIRNSNYAIQHKAWDGNAWYPSLTSWEDLGKYIE